jgi:hypothetical protein
VGYVVHSSLRILLPVNEERKVFRIPQILPKHEYIASVGRPRGIFLNFGIKRNMV